jgi:hypothetical protein
MSTWDTAAIRQLLSAAFDDGELTTLCFDYFRPVYEEFGGGMTKSAKIQRLLDHCERHDQMEVLLERVRERNPRKYASFAHRLRREPPTDITPSPPPEDIAQVSPPQRATPDEYFDLQIRIHRFDPAVQANPVEALLGNGSHFEGGTLHLDQDRLKNAEANLQEYGMILFDALFSGPIHSAYDQAIAYADIQAEKRLRVRLWIDNEAAELHEFAWERLHHRVQTAMLPIAASSEMPFSRYIGLTAPEPTPITKRPVRLLFAISNPGDLSAQGLASLDVEKEITNLLGALGNLRQAEQLQVTLMPGRTGLSDTLRSKLEREGYQICQGVTSMEHIIRTLSRDGGYHILHYLGHGQFDRRRRQAHLLLEDEDGNVERMQDERIAALLKSVGSQLRLVFLAACESAKRTPGDSNPFVGLAPKLIQVGIPAVVAMQNTVSFATARQLTSDFYSYLLERGVVDRAMNQARLLLFESGGTDWATPVLFMRLKDGRLFGAQEYRITQCLK